MRREKKGGMIKEISSCLFMLSILLSIIAAALPVFFWYLIIIRAHRKGMKFFFFLVFTIAGIFSAIFHLYNEEIIITLQSFLGILLGYIAVGIIVEYGKNFIIRVLGKNYFKGIDDVVDLAFATALGFTFIENIFIFTDLFSALFSGSLSSDETYGAPIEITKKILSQEFFILPIHLFCSGIFGYYYGLSLFAKESLRKKHFFATIQIIKGTILSTVTYGIFFFLKEQDLYIHDIALFFGIDNFPVDERLLPIISFGFFSAGSLFLFHLLEHKHYLTEEEKK